MLLDDVQIAGRTAADVRSELAERYAKHYRNPRVGVFARSFTNRTVYVTGEVAKGGGIPLHPGMTAMQAVIEAGGLMPNSRIQEAVLLRQAPGGTRQVIPLQLHEVLKGSGTDTPLQPADVVYIPKSDIRVFVGGEVAKPGLLPLEKDLTVLAAVMQAGGFVDTASRNKAMVLRNKGNGTPTVVEVKLEDVLKGTAQDTVLQPYDIVFVPKSKIARIDQAVDQYIRKVVPLTMTGGFSYVVGGLGAPGANCFF
jgi:polysaccharide export outer membrane protein